MKTPDTSHTAQTTGSVPAASQSPLGFLFLFCFLAFGLAAAESERVKLVRTPDGGIHPQAAVDSRGLVHLIFFKGDAGHGDIFYVRQQPGQETFSKPIQVTAGPAAQRSWVRFAARN